MENAPLVSESNKAVVAKPRSVPAPKMPAREPSLPGKLLAAGTAACIADLITFPLDTAKVRLQIQGEGSSASSTGSTTTGQHMLGRTAAAAAAAKPAKYRGVIGTVCTISRQEGPKALYNGLVPGLQRQMCFASVRIGLYDTVKGAYGNFFGQNQGQVGVGVRILAGITTGGMAVLCAQPTDVVKVRFQCQPAGMPRRYNGVMAAYRTIAVEEGVRGLWKGTSPNVARNCIVNAAELVSYDLIKSYILKMGLLSDNMPCHFVSAFGAGFCTTVVASPVDVIKTRFMNSGAGTYNGVLHCAQTMFKNEGPTAFYKGFMPSFMRLASWNVVMFVCYEQLKRAFSETPKMPAVQIERQVKRFA